MSRVPSVRVPLLRPFQIQRPFAQTIARAAFVAALCWGCSEPAQEAAQFTHSAVVQDHLAKLDQRLSQSAENSDSQAQAVDPEQVGGLVAMLATSSGGARELPLTDVQALGDGALAPLMVIATRTDKPQQERLAALELMEALGSLRATEQLLKICESSPEAWMRAQSAWRLGNLRADWTVSRLLYRLKYEVDEETRVWIARTLGLCGNYAGQDALYNTQNQGSTPELQQSAQQQIQDIVQASGVEDAQVLWNSWYVADPEGKILRKDPSDRFLREFWRLVSDLSGEHFQLRGVDDARYILSNLGAWATPYLCQALHDKDVYVRVHVAQCLERMRGRATGAGPHLLEALTDESLAPAAATALGEISFPLAEPKLRELLLALTSPHELRVACASALGRIALPKSLVALEQVLAADSEPYDLRQRAAISLCQMGRGEQAVPFLHAAMADVRVDRFGAEVAIGFWLGQLEGPAAASALEQWNALQPTLGLIATSEQAETRINSRHALLSQVLESLLNP